MQFVEKRTLECPSNEQFILGHISLHDYDRRHGLLAFSITGISMFLLDAPGLYHSFCIDEATSGFRFQALFLAVSFETFSCCFVDIRIRYFQYFSNIFINPQFMVSPFFILNLLPRKWIPSISVCSFVDS